MNARVQRKPHICTVCIVPVQGHKCPFKKDKQALHKFLKLKKKAPEEEISNALQDNLKPLRGLIERLGDGAPPNIVRQCMNRAQELMRRVCPENRAPRKRKGASPCKRSTNATPSKRVKRNSAGNERPKKHLPKGTHGAASNAPIDLPSNDGAAGTEAKEREAADQNEADDAFEQERLFSLARCGRPASARRDDHWDG